MSSPEVDPDVLAIARDAFLEDGPGKVGVASPRLAAVLASGGVADELDITGLSAHERIEWELLLAERAAEGSRARARRTCTRCGAEIALGMHLCGDLRRPEAEDGDDE